MRYAMLWIGVIITLLSATLAAAQNDTPYDEALRRIEEAAASGATELDLSDLGLEALPPEVGGLTQLRVLHVVRNQLSELPPEIGQLTNLQLLDLAGNRLRTLPPEIGQLTNLQQLSVQDNQLTALPSEMAELTNLQVLDVANNPLTFPPPEVVAQGLQPTMAFLREVNDGPLPATLVLLGSMLGLIVVWRLGVRLGAAPGIGSMIMLWRGMFKR